MVELVRAVQQLNTVVKQLEHLELWNFWNSWNDLSLHYSGFTPVISA
jgi:hypothetical protein